MAAPTLRSTPGQLPWGWIADIPAEQALLSVASPFFLWPVSCCSFLLPRGSPDCPVWQSAAPAPWGSRRHWMSALFLVGPDSCQSVAHRVSQPLCPGWSLELDLLSCIPALFFFGGGVGVCATSASSLQPGVQAPPCSYLPPLIILPWLLALSLIRPAIVSACIPAGNSLCKGGFPNRHCSPCWQ